MANKQQYQEITAIIDKLQLTKLPGYYEIKYNKSLKKRFILRIHILRCSSRQGVSRTIVLAPRQLREAL